MRVLRCLVKRQKSVEESEDTILANPIIMRMGIRKSFMPIARHGILGKNKFFPGRWPSADGWTGKRPGKNLFFPKIPCIALGIKGFHKPILMIMGLAKIVSLDSSTLFWRSTKCLKTHNPLDFCSSIKRKIIGRLLD